MNLISALAAAVVTYSGTGFPPHAAELETIQSAGIAATDDRVAMLLESMNDYLIEREQFRFTADVVYDRQSRSGQLIEVHETHDVAVQRPGSLRATVLGGDGARLAFVHDGTLSIVDPIRDVYFEAGVPGSLDEAIDVMIIDLGLSLPSADFVSEDPVRSLTARVTRSEYIGVSMITGVPCHQIAFAQDGLAWQLWISADLKPVPRRISMQYLDRPRNPRFSATLAWSFDETPYPASSFHFLTDSSMKKAETISEVIPPEGQK